MSSEKEKTMKRMECSNSMEIETPVLWTRMSDPSGCRRNISKYGSAYIPDSVDDTKAVGKNKMIVKRK